VNVTFGWPRINGEPAPVKNASAFYPNKSGPAAPDCATAKSEGANVTVEVGAIFKRDEAQRRHSLGIVKPSVKEAK